MQNYCPVCGQPDNCGDCDHTEADKITDEMIVEALLASFDQGYSPKQLRDLIEFALNKWLEEKVGSGQNWHLPINVS